MKIAHRVLLLIIINMISIIGTSGVIYHLGANEQEYYKLSNIILQFKYSLSKKQFSEKMILRDEGNLLETEQLDFVLKKNFKDIDQNLIRNKKNQLNEIEGFLERREVLWGRIQNDIQEKGEFSISAAIDYDSLNKIDDQLFIRIDDLSGEAGNRIKVREDYEIFAIISGLLLMTLMSIIITAAFGQSIVKPIEQLRSYVLSIDLSQIRHNANNKFKYAIDSRKHLEISQLADSYMHMENTLFNKMKELEKHSESLSNELVERKKTENQLIKTETYLTNIIQSLKSMIITTDSRFNLIHTNDLADELAVKTEYTLFSRFPYMTQYKSQIREVLEKSQPYFKDSIEIEATKGRFFNIFITPLAGEKTDGVVIRLDDITNIKNIERQLIETQKWETLGVLTSGFAHDFNNVLTGIVTSSSILMHKAEKDYPDLDKSFANCLSIIDKSGKRAATMVQQLLSLSRSSEMNLTNVDLNDSIRDIQSICLNSFDKSINIEVELLKKTVPVHADIAQLEQTLLNLCINGYHAMTQMRKKEEEPGGTLKISMKEVYIDRFFRHEGQECTPGEYIALSVSDTGVGISVEQQKKIFDPFFTTKDKTKGTGLGLTMVQHIIHKHKGMIELYSELGRGSIFTIYLPVSKQIESEKMDLIHNRELIEGIGTVLIIDDEEILRVLTESILKDCGYTILLAEDGFEGVDIYRKEVAHIDLVILDMSMPGMSGKEAFIQLKQINPEQKILMSSGFTKDDRIQDLLNLGLEGFIQKPYDFIELSQKVSEIIKS